MEPPRRPPPGSALFRPPLPPAQPARVPGAAAGPVPHGAAPHPRRHLGAGAGPEGVPGLPGRARGGGAGERGDGDAAAQGTLGGSGEAVAAPEGLLETPGSARGPQICQGTPGLQGGTPKSARDLLWEHLEQLGMDHGQ